MIMADKIATREAYGQALAEFGERYKDLVVLDADLAEATKTIIFKKKFPERFFDCGIAEGNMVSVAAGLAAAGKIPFASSFAMFAAGRAFEQIRNTIGYPHLNVKIGATHAGITVGEDGATHQCLEDFALMRSIPGMVVVSPADAIEARAAVEAAIKYEGPMYLRFGRYAVPVLYDNSYKFELGKGVKMTDGSDVTIFANGLLVSMALQAAEMLKADGISARVVNIHTVKPLDRELVISCAKETGAVVTAEEHNIIGGLGSAVCEVLSEECPVPVLRVGVEDVFGRSGKVPPLLEMYGLTPANIAAKAKAAIALKK
jgi:transketolase